MTSFLHRYDAMLCAVLCLVAQFCLTFCKPVDFSPPGASVHGDSPGKNTGVGSLSLLQGIFLTQESNWGLLHCRWILYQGSPWCYKYPLSSTDLPHKTLNLFCLTSFGIRTSWLGFLVLPCPYLQIRAVAICLQRTHLPMSLPKPSNLASRSFPPPLQPTHPGPACMLSHFSCVLLYLTLWTVARQTSLFMGLSRQGYWSRLPFPPPGDFSDPEIDSACLISPALEMGSLLLVSPGKPTLVLSPSYLNPTWVMSKLYMSFRPVQGFESLSLVSFCKILKATRKLRREFPVVSYLFLTVELLFIWLHRVPVVAHGLSL